MKRYATAALLMLSAATFASDKPLPGDSAPAFSATSLKGKTITLDRYRGQPVSLVFLDSLCPMPHWPDCEGQLAKVQKLAARDQKNQWVGVVKGFYVDEGWVKSFTERWQFEFPIIWDQDNSLFSTYKVFGNPYQIWLDEQGRIESRGDVITAEVH